MKRQKSPKQDPTTNAVLASQTHTVNGGGAYDDIGCVFVARILNVCANAGEAGDFGPGCARVSGLPEAISTSGAEIQGCRKVGIYD